MSSKMSMYLVGDNTFLMAPDDDTSFALVTIKTNRPINWWKELHENAEPIARFIVKYMSVGDAELFIMCASSYADVEATKIMRQAWDAAPDDVPSEETAVFTIIHQLVHGLTQKE